MFTITRKKMNCNTKLLKKSSGGFAEGVIKISTYHNETYLHRNK